MLKPWLPVLVCAVMAGGLMPLQSVSAWTNYYGYGNGNARAGVYLSGYGHGNSYGFSATAGSGRQGYRFSYTGSGGGVSNPMGYGSRRGASNSGNVVKTMPLPQTWLGKALLGNNGNTVCGSYNRMPESCYRRTTKYVAEMERNN